MPRKHLAAAPPDGGTMKKRTAIRAVTFLSAAVIVMGVLAWTGMRKARTLELYARANTQHAFDELVTSMSELSNALEKSVYATDPQLEGALCSQIMARAMTGQMAMGVLPYSSRELEQTSGFLARVGDYAGSLSRSVGRNGGYSDEEIEALRNLSETASILSVNLQDMQHRIMAGELTMDEVYHAAAVLGGDGEKAPLAGDVFQTIETEFPELPTLIYDGPFSEALSSPVVSFLEGREEVSPEQAKKAAAAFLTVEERHLTQLGERGGDIPCYTFVSYMNGGEYTVYVTKSGGYVTGLLCSRPVGESAYSVDVGLSLADDIMARLNFENMERSYHIVEDGILLVNYEYVQDGVMCYPDLVKIGIALDNGMLMSYDAEGYMRSHRKREIPEEEISRVDAQESVPVELTVLGHQMAMIPAPGGEELYCHEFLCRAENEQKYLIYVNAETGAEERILILLEDENGALTI